MRSKLKLSIVTIFISVLFLSGCATNRWVIDVPMPASGEVSKSNGKEIYINSVTDSRVFEVSPPEPNIPSLDPDEKQGDKIKQRAIARKRNGFGKGLGDILLPEGKTVESLISATLRQAFIENGYTVLNKKEQITDNTYLVDARINKLWSWMNPGFWAITLSTEITTDIAIKNKGATNEKVVSVKVSDTFQTGVESNWIEVMQSGLKAYINKLKLSIIPLFQRGNLSSNAPTLRDTGASQSVFPRQNMETVRAEPYYEMPVTQTNATPNYENNQQVQFGHSGVDLTHCLKLQTNEAIARCAGKGR